MNGQVLAARASDLVAPSPNVSVRRWPAALIAHDASQAPDGEICATMWPTRTLTERERWFDELYIWTEGFHASTMQRARIQVAALDQALRMLDAELATSIGVTLSFGTVERHMDSIIRLLQAFPLVSHRIVLILRGSLDRLRSQYRIRGLVDYLRSGQVAVGYRVSAPRVTMEIRALDLIQPEFAKVLAPTSSREEFWRDFVCEARVAGVAPQSLIVAGLETERQVELARQAGVRFGQGNGVRASFLPPDVHDRVSSAGIRLPEPPASTPLL